MGGASRVRVLWAELRGRAQGRGHCPCKGPEAGKGSRSLEGAGLGTNEGKKQGSEDLWVGPDHERP